MLYPQHYGNDPLFPSSKDFKVIRKDKHSGKGVITYRGFERGQVIAKMTGDIIGEIRQHTLQISREKHLFDPYFSGYFLHACTPNIFLDMKAMMVTALEDIPPMSFLYMDYAQTEDVLFKQFPCNCGAHNCRSWVMGKNETLPILQDIMLESTQRASHLD